MSKLMLKGRNYSGGGGEFDTSIIADDFNSTTSYAVDDYCVYEGALYKCTTAHTGTWNASHFTETQVSEELGSGTFAGLSDVQFTNLEDGQVPQYNSTLGKWTNGPVAFPPEGSTVTPVNSIQVWLHCGNVWEKPYTTLLQVLNDGATLYTLINTPNAVDYLVRSTDWVSDITSDITAMALIGMNNYCSNTMLADSTWRTAICNSTYFENVLNVKVPTMTSSTTPSGVASASSQYSECPAYKAFTPNGIWTVNNILSSGSTATAWLQYQFPNDIDFVYTPGALGWSTFVSGKLEGSLDGTTWFYIEDSVTSWRQKTITAPTKTRYIRFTLTVKNDLGYGQRLPEITDIQYYGRVDIPSGTNTIVYSAANDTLTFTDRSGTKTVTTNSSGVGYANIDFDNRDAITFTSSVAKDPNNLSSAYSKTVTMRYGNVEVYVMPDGYVLYWWGYKNNLEEINTTNGWYVQWEQGSLSPTYATNSIQCRCPGGNDNHLCGVGNATALSSIYASGTVVLIGQGVLVSGGTSGVNDKIMLRTSADKQNVSLTHNDPPNISGTTMQKTTTTANYFVEVHTARSRTGDAFAIYVTT